MQTWYSFACVVTKFEYAPPAFCPVQSRFRRKNEIICNAHKHTHAQPNRSRMKYFCWFFVFFAADNWIYRHLKRTIQFIAKVSRNYYMKSRCFRSCFINVYSSYCSVPSRPTSTNNCVGLLCACQSYIMFLACNLRFGVFVNYIK